MFENLTENLLHRADTKTKQEVPLKPMNLGLTGVMPGGRPMRSTMDANDVI